MLRAILLDLDGTIYKGKTAIEGANEVLDLLRKKGLKVYFVTNAATRSRAGVVEKLAGMGIHAEEKEVYCTTYAAARYITKNLGGKTVFCVGEQGMKDEFGKHGITVVEDDSAGIVVVGLDRTVDYEKLSKGYRAIEKGAEFIATNCDVIYPVEDGYLPGAGALVAAMESCTGKKPFVIGKPETYFVELIHEEEKLEKDEMIVVGDRVDTDIIFAKNAGIKSVLVLTGVTGKNEIEKLEERPDYVIESISDLPGLIEKLSP